MGRYRVCAAGAASNTVRQGRLDIRALVRRLAETSTESRRRVRVVDVNAQSSEYEEDNKSTGSGQYLGRTYIDIVGEAWKCCERAMSDPVIFAEGEKPERYLINMTSQKPYPGYCDG